MTTNDAVAKRISKLLKEKGMTLYRLEQKSGVYHGVMDRIIKGKNNTISLSTLYKISIGFGMSIIEFLDDDSIFCVDKLDLE